MPDDPCDNEGLSSVRARALRAQLGPNEIVEGETSHLLAQVLRRLANPLVLILLLASGASALLRDFVNAAIVLAIVLASILVEAVQSHRSARASASLKSSVAQTATVERDGRWTELPRAELVPGDLVRVSAGDLVPADLRLVDARDLHLNEAALTGESMPVEKVHGGAGELGMLRLGSSVVSGLGKAVVVETGSRTTFGAIAAKLSTRPPTTNLDQSLAAFGHLILKTVTFLVLFVLVVAAYHRRSILETILFAVALAVGLTPEFLPMITTVTLTRGALRMASSKVIVKDLAAIEALGTMDVLCSDKTGTLTTGKMTLERHVDARGVRSERVLSLAYLNSYFESGIDNPLDTAVLRRGRRDPLDEALLSGPHPDVAGFAKLDEIPFDFERRRVSVVVRRARGPARIVTKGAPENVLAACTTWEVDGERIPLDEAGRAECARTFEELSRDGYRVLGVASGELATASTYGKADERGLSFAGFVAFSDPLRTDAVEALGALRRDGIALKILTGDSELVAARLSTELGLRGDRLLCGRDLEAMSDPALARRAEDIEVFARVSPSQKHRILLALRSRGHVVGFVGDGINDAPSLHAADVGISVANAVDVAREAAQVILLRPGLAVLHAGVREGRRASANVMKYLLMGTSSNFGNVVSMALASVLLPFLPMLPTQILLNNFLYDLAQLTIPYDRVDPGALRSPQGWDMRLVRRFMMWIGPISSVYDLLTFAVLLRWFHADAALFHTGWFVESLATQTLVIFVIRTGAGGRSRPAFALVATTALAVGVALVLPFTAAGRALGFVPLPPAFFAFLTVATATYLGVVTVAKRLLTPGTDLDEGKREDGLDSPA